MCVCVSDITTVITVQRFQNIQWTGLDININIEDSFDVKCLNNLNRYLTHRFVIILLFHIHLNLPFYL